MSVAMFEYSFCNSCHSLPDFRLIIGKEKQSLLKLR